MPDIRIVPGNAIMSFTSSLNFIERLTQDPSGSLNLYGSGSTGRTELLSVDGNNGRLFTVSDDLSDSLFSVNTIAGLPVIEAFADNTVNIGQYSAPPIKITGSQAIITGSLAGGSSWANTALVFGENTNATRYPLFASSLSGTPQTIYGDGNFTYNPSTNVLTAGTFSGTLSGTATNASNIAVTDTTTTNATHYVTFTTGTSGNQVLRVDSNTLTFNPNTNTFVVPIVNSTTAVRGGNGSAGAPAFSFSGDTDNGMYYIGTNSIGFSTGGTARMSIDSSGNVGIGFTSSTYRLQVNDIIATVTGFGNFTALQALGGAGYRWSLNNDSTFRLNRTTNGFSSVTTPIMVDSSDRVGIGTTSMVRDFQVGAFSGSPEICIASSTTGNGTISFGDGASGNDPWRGYVQYQHSTDRMVLGTANAGWLTLTSGGALGLNILPTNTAGRFEASNDIVAYSSSDKNWKKNIKNIDSPLEKLSQINGVEFDWIEDEPVHGNKGHDIGVIAQEIEQVLPQIVQTRESGMKAVQYDKIIPLLIESIKEQQKQIDELKQIINGFTK